MSKRIIVTVSEELHSNIETSAKELGVSITEYVRHLILKAQEEKGRFEL